MGLDSFTQKAETPSTQLLAALPRVMNRRSSGRFHQLEMTVAM